VEVLHPGQRRISLAFFGTILIYLAGQPALGDGVPAMTWSLLQAAAARMDPAILDRRFHLPADRLRTKVGLAPLHAWRPMRTPKARPPISAVLSGLLLNVALHALVRFKFAVPVNRRRSIARSGHGGDGPGVADLRAFMLYHRWRDISGFSPTRRSSTWV